MSAAGESGRLFIGLISGTSMDGVDAALVRLGDRTCEVLAALAHSYPSDLVRSLSEAGRDPQLTTADDIGHLDNRVGQCFAEAALALLDDAGQPATAITAIGSHGQTLRHRPDDDPAFTMQIGDPNVIAAMTRIPTVADFRRADMAAGGQGAPLAPAFHNWLMAEPGRPRAVLNIGGIANITILPGDEAPVTGFDTGPGNTLMDAWILENQGERFDADGQWARTGAVAAELLAQLKADPYFGRLPPKSTGFEHFNLGWLKAHLERLIVSPEDVQATLLELSASSIADAIRQHSVDEVLVCGGGVHNGQLMDRLGELLSPTPVTPTDAHGLDPDWVEACAFGWLASRRLDREPGNLPSVTGAEGFRVLGAVYLCAS